MMWVLFMCFAVPFCIVSGIALPMVFAEWVEKKLEKGNK